MQANKNVSYRARSFMYRLEQLSQLLAFADERWQVQAEKWDRFSFCGGRNRRGSPAAFQS